MVEIVVRLTDYRTRLHFDALGKGTIQGSDAMSPIFHPEKHVSKLIKKGYDGLYRESFPAVLEIFHSDEFCKELVVSRNSKLRTISV